MVKRYCNIFKRKGAKAQSASRPKIDLIPTLRHLSLSRQWLYHRERLCRDSGSPQGIILSDNVLSRKSGELREALCAVAPLRGCEKIEIQGIFTDLFCIFQKLIPSKTVPQALWKG